MTTPAVEEPAGLDDLFRRISPHPGKGRRPGLVTVLVRWRAEVLAALLLAWLWHFLDGLVLGIVLAVLLACAVAVPVARHGLAGALLTVVATHRVRVGLVQAGIGDRNGRPPWLPWARPMGGKGVLVRVWLRGGTTVGDLRAATPVLATACGASAVEVEQRGLRADRVVLLVVRPRWGCLSR